MSVGLKITQVVAPTRLQSKLLAVAHPTSDHLGIKRTKRAPLINLPVINTFSKITVDIVGPLTPYAVSGNRFILTVIDFASHFSLAYPIKTRTAAEVVRCLVLSCRLDFPIKYCLIPLGNQTQSHCPTMP